jgi:uncharacterized protein YjdB
MFHKRKYVNGTGLVLENGSPKVEREVKMIKKQMKRIVLMFLLVFCFGLGVKTETAMAAESKVDVTFNAPLEVNLSGYSLEYYYFSAPYDGMTVKISLMTTDDVSYTMRYYRDGYYASSKYSGSQEITTTLGEAGSYYVQISPASYSSSVQGTLVINDVSTYATIISASGDTELNLLKGCSANLGVSSNEGIAAITWTSSNSQVASVDTAGTVTGGSIGTATITASLAGGNTVKYVVTVSDALKIGEKYFVSAKSYPDFKYKFTTKYDGMEFLLEISPSTENKYCVYLDDKIQDDNYYTTGSLSKKISVASSGSHTIEISASGGDFRGSFIIKDTTTYAKSIKKKSTPSNMTVLATQQLGVSMNGVGKVSWESSNKKIATVSSNGLVKAKKMGKVTITATLENGNSVKYKVVVNKMNINIWSDEFFSLKSYVNQITGYSKGTWKSSKKKAVTVSDKGKITAKDDGKNYEAAKVTFKVSGTTYTFNIYKYDKESMYEEAVTKLKKRLKNPSSLIVNEYSFNSVKTAKGGTLYVYIDYSAMNGFGGYSRSYCKYYCEDGKNSIFIK